MAEKPAVVTESGRHFDCVPAAVLVFVVDEQGKFLLLRHPQRTRWEMINGALDAGETVLDAARREVAEEAGADVRVRLLGPVHIQSFDYDGAVRNMLSLGFVAAYEGGEVAPGDDMAGSEVGWFDLETVEDEGFPFILPNLRWLFRRALALYFLWRDETVTLQSPPEKQPLNKYRQAEADRGGR